MLDFSHIPTQFGAANVQTFIGISANATSNWQTWQKPRGKSMCNILLIGKGGNGGLGVVGANSTAAGGGGGGSGGQTSLTMPLWAIPDILHLSLAGMNPSITAISSYVAIAPGVVNANNTIALANGGGVGGNASGATAGAAGGAGAVATAAGMPLGFPWADALLVGQAGIIGGVAVAGGALTLPVTGLLVTGGTGGGGLPAAAAVGTNGGAFTAAGAFPPQIGGKGAAAATTPPENGSGGYNPISGLFYGYGGTGGGSTHGSATGAGLIASIGGNGAPGCGGGGNGGSLTGTPVAATVGLGGPALCIITCW